MVTQSTHCSSFFFFNDTATTEIYTLSLHDALPIYAVHDLQPPPARVDRHDQPPGPARPARRLPAAIGLRRRRVLPPLLGRVRRRRARPLARRTAPGDPPGAHGLGPADSRDAQGAAWRVHGRRRARRRPAAPARRAARQDRPALDRGGLPRGERGAPHAKRPAATVRPGRDGEGSGAAGAVQPHRQRHRLPRVSHPETPARLDRKVELRRPRHRAPRDRHRGRSGEQAVRVRRRAEPGRQRHAAERDQAGRPRRPHHPGIPRSPRPPGRVPVLVGDRADARLLALDDPVRRGPLHAGEEGGARPHPPHSHAVPRGHAARRAVSRYRRGDPPGAAGAGAGGALSHEHRRGAEAVAPHAAVAAQGHAPDHHDHGRQAVGAPPPRRPDLRQLDGARPADPPGHLPRGGAVPPQRDPDQHVHAGARPQSRGVREEGVGDLPREGLFHEHDDAGAVHPDGLHAEKDPPGVSEFVFGTHNAAFVQVMYEQYLRDPASVGEEWRNLFDNGRLADLPVIPTSRAEVLRSGEQGAVPSAAPPSTAPRSPLPAGLTPITGPAARLAQNMTDSLSVPTATSFREIVVDTLDARRRELNARLAAGGKKISYTHLIGYAIVQAARAFPVMTHAFQEAGGKPHRLDPGGVSLGLAVDVQKKDGSRTLVVPVIKHAEGMNFAAFHATYETLVEKARTGRLLPDDFAGGTMTLTNPGTIGTVASVPRLMKGQGSIVATGAIRQPGSAKIVTITSTYDHRVIQGAESGMFLRKLDALLQGEDGFYERVFESLDVTGIGTRETGNVSPPAATLPVSRFPIPEVARPGVEDLKHVAAAMALVKAIRHFGHLAARLDPLGSEPPGDPALDPGPLGLTPENMTRVPAELLRIYVPGRTLAEAYPELLKTYCGTIAYEVEHIGSHQERVWLRRVIESGQHRPQLAADEKRKLLSRLTAVEMLERFLHTAHLWQKRLSVS